MCRKLIDFFRTKERRVIYSIVEDDDIGCIIFRVNVDQRIQLLARVVGKLSVIVDLVIRKFFIKQRGDRMLVIGTFSPHGRSAEESYSFRISGCLWRSMYSVSRL